MIRAAYDPKSSPPLCDRERDLAVGIVACLFNELYVADGYVNRRVIVYDADAGTFKRMWGAYGNRPDDRADNTPHRCSAHAASVGADQRFVEAQLPPRASRS